MLKINRRKGKLQLLALSSAIFFSPANPKYTHFQHGHRVQLKHRKTVRLSQDHAALEGRDIEGRESICASQQ